MGRKRRRKESHEPCAARNPAESGDYGFMEEHFQSATLEVGSSLYSAIIRSSRDSARSLSGLDRNGNSSLRNGRSQARSVADRPPAHETAHAPDLLLCGNGPAM